ncbi:transferase hexapeptide repeat containing protein [Halovivax asiaticus JCM 14624]|uniref:Transferase hexapeptide repeat containing protein n=1 Tax=Halovivax asiaticus JCM 14624 TaxID=1227490 RepID=M0BLI5_9EURY|nr:acyltransferase [Halovivax asiaticus]ELZ11163.1 transferase hexapeptide repeat containing protein [Halovivax asiaticus JCM 14624]
MTTDSHYQLAAIDDGATVGYSYDDETTRPAIGAETTIRAGTIVYDDVVMGEGCATGHNALIRELTELGDDVLVGTNAVIDGRTTVGSHVSIQSGVYIPSDTTIGSNVFLGPYAVLTNDPYPIRQDVELEGPTLEDGVSVGSNATILPGVTVGEDSFVAAGAIVTEDVPSETLAVGTPAQHRPLPDTLQSANDI